MAKWLGMLCLVVAVTLSSTVPAYAWKGHRGHRHWHKHYGYRRPSVVVVPRVVVPFGLPYVYPRAVVVAPPPVFVPPAPQVYMQSPPPPPLWYYCDNPPGYYPYVPQCPGGWRQVLPTPPR
jgi:hypothetical protein